MLEIVVIGIGTGNPEHMTVEAIGALNAADLVLIPRKGAAKADLAELRRAICDRYLDEPRDPDRRVRHAAPRRGRRLPRRASRPGTGRSPASTARLLDGVDGTRRRCWSGATPRSTTARCASSTTSRPAGSPSRGGWSRGSPACRRWPRATASRSTPSAAPVHVTTGRRLREAVPDAELDRGDARRRRRLPRGAGARTSTSAGAPTSGWTQEIVVAGPLAEVGDRIARAPRGGAGGERLDHGRLPAAAALSAATRPPASPQASGAGTTVRR